MRTTHATAALLTAVALTGCGSSLPADYDVAAAPGSSGRPGTTAPPTSSAAQEPGLSGPGVPGVPELGPPAAAGRDSTGQPAGSSSGSGGSTFVGGGAASTPGGTTAVRHGAGVTAKEIFVGVTYTADAQQANRAIGAEISQGDTKANAEAIIAEINERGGVAGRRLVPVFFAYEAQSSQTNSQQDQNACSHFTEDNKVFAVLSDGYTDTFRECMKKNRVLQLVGGTLYGDERDAYASNRQVFNLHGPTQDRWFAALVPALVRQGYFRGWNTATAAPGEGRAVVGVIGFDTPMWTKPVPRTLLPALARAGHPVDPDNVVYIHAPNGNAELGESAAEIQSAVLRYQQNGVTHVVFADTTGGLTLLFTAAARNQGYYPRWGIGSVSGVQALYDAGAFGAKEISGAKGIGWAPSLDLPARDGDRYATASTKRCMALMKKRTGQEYATTNEASIALSQCDELELLALAVGRIRGAIDLQSAVAAIETIGARFEMAARPTMRFSRDKHDGVELAWDMSWDAACPCIRYAGPGHPMR